ncbi:MAG: hypothetical protein J0H29_12965 [Sphingobacteriales bacterium]|nr:hypothetical protein [Sphingobacteriales bacterium]OJY81790.1 MAG: hypothetical protein BGP14_03210 [Sphingobacteriales bacterium 44-15]
MISIFFIGSFAPLTKNAGEYFFMFEEAEPQRHEGAKLHKGVKVPVKNCQDDEAAPLVVVIFSVPEMAFPGFRDCHDL